MSVPSRVIRGEINSSASLNRVSIGAELTFDRLITAVDDFGRFDARPEMLKAALFPVRADAPHELVMEWVGELEHEGCVQLYEIKGRPFLCLPGWEKHRGNQRRRKESIYPDPPQGSSNASKPMPRKSGNLQEVTAGVGVGVGLGVGGGVTPAAAPPPATPDPPQKPTPKRKPGTPCPEDLTNEQWAQVRAWQEKKHPEFTESHLSNEWDRHVDWHIAHGSTRKDWVRSYYSWLTNGIGQTPTASTSTARADPKPWQHPAGMRLCASVEDAKRVAAEFAKLRDEAMPRRRYVT